MAKSNLTKDDLAPVMEQSDELIFRLHDINSQITKSRVEPGTVSNEDIRNIAALASAASSLVSTMLVRKAMDEDKAELKALLRKQAAGE